jgi:hypothetical protein
MAVLEELLEHDTFRIDDISSGERADSNDTKTGFRVIR